MTELDSVAELEKIPLETVRSLSLFDCLHPRRRKAYTTVGKVGIYIKSRYVTQCSENEGMRDSVTEL